MNRSTQVTVIGGGISGLTAAHELCKNGVSVTVLEGAAQLGGIAGFFESSDVYIDRFYHCIMPSDVSVLALIQEVGLSEQLFWKSTGSEFIYDRRRYPFNTPLDLLRFRPLSFFQRLRLGVMGLLLPHLGKGLELDRVRTDVWIRKLFGNAIWERMWEPLFRTKFGVDAGNLPALYIRQRMGRESNQNTRGYLTCGLKGFLDALAFAIERKGGHIRRNARVRSIRETGDGMRVIVGEEEAIECDWVLSTAPIRVTRRLTQGSELEGILESWDIPYRGVVSTVCFLSRPLDGFYMVPMVRCPISFDGLMEMSALIHPSYYGNRHLVYLVKYCDSESTLFEEEDTSIADRWCSELIDLYADLPLRREEILERCVFKTRLVEPVYQTGYLSMKPDIQVGRSCLFLATSAHAYPNMTSMNSCIFTARSAVTDICRKISAKP